MAKLNMVDIVAIILVVVGGLNWLLATIGADLGTWSSATWWQGLMKVVYLLVGVSAIYLIYTHKKDCKHCETSSNPPAQTM